MGNCLCARAGGAAVRARRFQHWQLDCWSATAWCTLITIGTEPPTVGAVEKRFWVGGDIPVLSQCLVSLETIADECPGLAGSQSPGATCRRFVYRLVVGYVSLATYGVQCRYSPWGKIIRGCMGFSQCPHACEFAPLQHVATNMRVQWYS